MYEKVTRSIKVRVEPVFLEEQSIPEQNIFVWAYHVEIENIGPEKVQLINRHWKITDSLGRTQEVRGIGVVGEQPVLNPGQKFSYTSGTPLSTPSGVMFGTYEMEDTTGHLFDVVIPAFSLDSPHEQLDIH